MGRLFDFAGTNPLAGRDDPPRIVSASVVLGQVGWFFKLSGSADAVEPQFASFTNFIATLKFQPAASEVNFDKIMAEARQANPLPSYSYYYYYSYPDYHVYCLDQGNIYL